MMTLKELMNVTNKNVEITISGKPGEVTEDVRYASPADVLDDDTNDGLNVVEVGVEAYYSRPGWYALWVRVSR